jgi:hypothetical protein
MGISIESARWRRLQFTEARASYRLWTNRLFDSLTPLCQNDVGGLVV